MPGTLYVVATPIGNVEDVTLRALRVLREVDLITAEDTRVTRQLLAHYQIETPLTSYQQNTRGRKAEALVRELSAGRCIALVSDAGMPGISDPGHELIQQAIAAGVTVVPVPGASALLSALVASGLSTIQFAFEGFPPRDADARATYFHGLRDATHTLVFYESPRRLRATLRDLHAAFGDRRGVIARDLTKPSEAFVRGTLGDLAEQFATRKPGGECVIVVEGMEPD